MGLVSIWLDFFGLIYFSGSVFWFQAYETEPNIFLNILIGFFFMVRLVNPTANSGQQIKHII
jgi:hypothetical protein